MSDQTRYYPFKPDEYPNTPKNLLRLANDLHSFVGIAAQEECLLVYDQGSPASSVDGPFVEFMVAHSDWSQIHEDGNPAYTLTKALEKHNAGVAAQRELKYSDGYHLTIVSTSESDRDQ